MRITSNRAPNGSRRVKVAAAIMLAGVIGAGPIALPLPAQARSASESFADLIDQVGSAVVLITAEELRQTDRSEPDATDS